MFVFFAVLTWAVVLVPSAVLMRRSPEDMGLHPDGIDPGTVKNAGQQQEPGIDETAPVTEPEPVWNRNEVLRTGTFWLLTICFAVNSLSFQAINLSLAPYIQDLGYKDTMLAAVITFRALLIGIGTLLMGFLAERAHKTAVRVMPFLIQALGSFFFLMGQNPIFLWLGVALYGFGSAGIHVTQEVVWADYYGRPSLGLVRSLGFSIAYGFGAMGPVIMNAMFDILGSYELAFITIVAALCIAAF
jgi:cyanate permease